MRRMLRQCPKEYNPGRKPVVLPENRGARSLRLTRFADLTDAQANVADHFDYYNHEWRHSSIDYQ